MGLDTIIQEKPTLRFTGCDKIASFYDALNIPSQKTVGLLGGKSYVWYIEEEKQSFHVSCTCNIFTLGFGALTIGSRMTGISSSSGFRGKPIVDLKTAKLVMQGIFFANHEVRLPVPDKFFQGKEQRASHL
jgi:hypothetical protein